jgi:hypothetical protein
MFNIYSTNDVHEMHWKNALWCQPRFVLFKNKTKIGNHKQLIILHASWCEEFTPVIYPYAVLFSF